jgi:hypothetical protein
MIPKLPIGHVAARILCAGTCLALLAATPSTFRAMPDVSLPGSHAPVPGLRANLPDAHAVRMPPMERRGTGSTAPHADRFGIHPIGLSGDGQPHDQAGAATSASTAHLP